MFDFIILQDKFLVARSEKNDAIQRQEYEVAITLQNKEKEIKEQLGLFKIEDFEAMREQLEQQSK